MLRQRLRAVHASDEGFTLIELLIVVVVIGVLAGITIFGVDAFKNDGKNAVCVSDKKSVEIRIRVANPNLKIKVGMEGIAEIGVANKTHDALLVPTDALLRQGDKKFVYVIDGNVAAKQEVTTGGFFEGMVEIKTGVKANEQVVTRGGSSLKEDEEYIKVSQ